jgi:hypothetical protein
MVKQFSARNQAYSNIWLCLQAISQVEEISWQPLVVAPSLVVSRLFADGSLMGFRSASALFHEVLNCYFQQNSGAEYRTGVGLQNMFG